jgi:hypothetical protein
VIFVGGHFDEVNIVGEDDCVVLRGSFELVFVSYA